MLWIFLHTSCCLGGREGFSANCFEWYLDIVLCWTCMQFSLQVNESSDSSIFTICVCYLIWHCFFVCIRLCKSWTCDIQETGSIIWWYSTSEGLCRGQTYLEDSTAPMASRWEVQPQRGTNLNQMGKWCNQRSSWRPWSTPWSQNWFPSEWSLKCPINYFKGLPYIMRVP